MFGRRKKANPHRAQKESEALRGTPVDPHAGGRAEIARPQGPWDVADVDLEESGGKAANRVDLGGLIVTGAPGLEMRLQVDEQTQTVAAVMLVAEDGAVELRAFAAPRTESIWAEVRREIGAEATRRGGTATEEEGDFGPEVKLVVPVTSTEGKQGAQVSRVVGVSAPRWLLRGTFLGRPAAEPDAGGLLEQAFRQVIVRRGDAPMAPRAAIPLRMPPDAQQSGTAPTPSA
ncbi:MAG TPA: DUF3710 domain-containing protein [Nocardioidaceae bacterium]|nr:DUF3710 domain-containing protein [Nocardioidaceae bacterium]